MRKQLLRYSLVGASLALLCVGVLIPSRSASAAVTASWVDKNTISINGTNYVNCAVSTGCSNLGNTYYIPNGFTLTTNTLNCGQPSAITPNIGKTLATYKDGKGSLVTITAITTGTVPGSRGTVKTCTKTEDLNFGGSQAPTNTPTITGVFVTKALIKLSDGSVYKDTNVSDSTKQYTLNGGSDERPDCVDLIKGFSADNKTATLYSGEGGTSVGCKYTASKTVTLDTAASIYNYAWTSTKTIQKSDGTGDVYTQNSDGVYASTNTNGKCTNTITVDNPDSSVPTTGIQNKKTVVSGGRSPTAGCMDHKESIQIAALSADNGLETPPGTECSTENTDDGTCTNEDDSTLDCGAGAMNWIICTGIEILMKGANHLDSLIMDQLNVDTHDIFSTQSKNSKAYYEAWNAFRVLATAGTGIVGLIMVGSQVFGLEFLSAYTIRKLLPRLLVAIVAISLSWPLMQFLINFFNVVGYDLRALIYSPFASLAKEGSSGGLIALTNPLSLIAAGTVLFQLYGTTVFTFLLTGFIALMIALAVLMVRELGLIVLVVTAPIAIICYALPMPAVQKVSQFWSTNFWGLLAMFPMISALIAASHVMSAVGRGPGASIFQQIFSLVVYFAGYAMIPWALRTSTGLAGNFANFLNNQAKPAFERLEKARDTAREHRSARRKEHREKIWTARRADWTSQLQDAASNGSWVRRRALRTAARAMGGWHPHDNIAAHASALQAAATKEIGDQVSNGDDTEVRALNAIESTRKWDATANNGVGAWTYKTLAGRTVSEAAVKRARQRWGHNIYAQQASLAYEMGKASSEEELQSIAKNYGEVSETWGMSVGQARGAWIGAAFSQQNSHLEFKNMGLDIAGAKRGGMSMDAGGQEKFVNEIYEKRGSYNLAQMGSNTIEELKNAHKDAADIIAAGEGARYIDASGTQKEYTAADITKAIDRRQKIAAVAETFMRDMGAAGYAAAGAAGASGAAADGRRQANTPGSAHTAERVRELTKLTRVYDRAPTGLYPPDHAPTENHKEQT